MNIDVELRPKTLDEMFNPKINESLGKAIANSGRIEKSYLFSGKPGSGKTTTARALGSYILTGRMDIDYNVAKDDNQSYIEVDTPRYNTAKEMRELLDEVAGSPPLLEENVILVLDEAHMLSNAAKNVLLKTLEEPPEHLYIVLCTTKGERIPDDVKNRCEIINFGQLPTEKLVKFGREYVIPKVKKIYEQKDNLTPAIKENIAKLTDKELEKISTYCNGTYRRMVKLINSYINTGQIEQLENDKENTKLLDLVQSIVNPTPASKNKVQEAIHTPPVKGQPEDLRIALCNYIGAVYINRLKGISLKSIDNSNYLRAMRTLSNPLDMSCQKADLVTRLIAIIMNNAGIKIPKGTQP